MGPFNCERTFVIEERPQDPLSRPCRGVRHGVSEASFIVRTRETICIA